MKRILDYGLVFILGALFWAFAGRPALSKVRAFAEHNGLPFPGATWDDAIAQKPSTTSDATLILEPGDALDVVTKSYQKGGKIQLRAYETMAGSQEHYQAPSFELNLDAASMGVLCGGANAGGALGIASLAKSVGGLALGVDPKLFDVAMKLAENEDIHAEMNNLATELGEPVEASIRVFAEEMSKTLGDPKTQEELTKLSENLVKPLGQAADNFAKELHEAVESGRFREGLQDLLQTINGDLEKFSDEMKRE